MSFMNHGNIRVVSREHLHVLVDAWQRCTRIRRPDAVDCSILVPLWHPSPIGSTREVVYDYTDESLSRLGQMLEAENLRSYAHSHSSKVAEVTRALKKAGPYVYRKPDVERTDVEILRAVASYAYQACDCPDWTYTEAHEFCRALERMLVCRLPGYSEAPSEIGEP